jgi:hypothetical protein
LSRRLTVREIRHTTSAQPTRMVRFHVRPRERPADGPLSGQKTVWTLSGESLLPVLVDARPPDLRFERLARYPSFAAAPVGPGIRPCAWARAASIISISRSSNAETPRFGGCFFRFARYACNCPSVCLPICRTLLPDSLAKWPTKYSTSNGIALARAARGPPGNIRELQNVVERAVILSETDTFIVDEGWLVISLFLLPSPAIAPLHTV